MKDALPREDEFDRPADAVLDEEIADIRDVKFHGPVDTSPD